MTEEQKNKIKRLIRSYRTMDLQVECIDYEINITKECIEGLKELRYAESYIIEKNREI
ncbi:MULTISPECIES: hypothetical protein [Clostridium]|uniref:hypothetical protein n=1 Tax=Clostridium TaxID=1485 RepID=UPI0024BD1FAF|nr:MULTISPECIES: hypothetical protein [Clostridium]EGT0681289.1 hypothetical protein [Clostridium perfringens]MDU2094908.1 hypothetical protein [Clostridium perfringens]MDU2227909.1 hypothetical protein [Clostridium perfringens]MDU4146096.1 hypothetical protein [Clostridium sp.]